jgi:hypothetical protein
MKSLKAQYLDHEPSLLQRLQILRERMKVDIVDPNQDVIVDIKAGDWKQMVNDAIIGQRLRHMFDVINPIDRSKH